MKKASEKTNIRAEEKTAKKEKSTKHTSDGTLRDQYENLAFALRFLWSINKKLFLLRILLTFLQTVQTLVPIFFVRAILNELTGGHNIRTILFYSSIMAVSIFGIRIVSLVFEIWDDRERTKLGFATSEHLSNSVMGFTYFTLENPEMQDFVELAIYNRFDNILQYATDIFGSVITLISVGSLVITLNPLILSAILFSTMVRFLIDRYQRKLPLKYNDERKRKERINSYLNGLMSDVDCGKDIRVNNIEDWIYKKSEKSWQEDLFPIDSAFQKKLLTISSLMGIIGTFQDIIIYIILAVQVASSSLTIGDFSMFLTAANTFSGAIMGVTGKYSELMIQTLGYLRDYRRCLSIAEKQKEEHGNTHIGIPENVEIEFRDVSFKYPNTDRLILEHINIKIAHGETLSIVGINGAGKTTFVKLLCRFYEPTEGEILVNNVSVKDIPLDEYYKLLSVVFQEFNLFCFSIRENIIVNGNFDEKRFNDIIRKCGLEECVKKLPKGADTYLEKICDPDGVDLSGGERQKIANARAAYRDAPIMVFDEPTSGLDPIAEYEVYKSFHGLVGNHTAIYISHRMSSTRFTDRTAVFADGTIAEYGTHDELMALDGRYKEMFTAQAKYYQN